MVHLIQDACYPSGLTALFKRFPTSLTNQEPTVTREPIIASGRQALGGEPFLKKPANVSRIEHIIPQIVSSPRVYRSDADTFLKVPTICNPSVTRPPRGPGTLRIRQPTKLTLGVNRSPLGNCVRRTRLERDLLALETTTTAAATEAAATATTATAATAATASSKATTATTAAATTEAATTTTTAPETTILTRRPGSRVVQAAVPAVDGLAIQLLESTLGVLNRVECDVAETLATTRLPVNRLVMHTYRSKGV